jgi:hypothetical protein
LKISLNNSNILEKELQNDFALIASLVNNFEIIYLTIFEILQTRKCFIFNLSMMNLFKFLYKVRQWEYYIVMASVIAKDTEGFPLLNLFLNGLKLKHYKYSKNGFDFFTN